MPDVTIYTKPYCTYCIRAISLLEKKGIAFTEIEAAFDAEKRADVLTADEDLRKGRTARALHHLGALLRVEGGFDLGKRNALLLQQRDRADAVGAVPLGIDRDVGHGCSNENPVAE